MYMTYGNSLITAIAMSTNNQIEPILLQLVADTQYKTFATK